MHRRPLRLRKAQRRVLYQARRDLRAKPQTLASALLPPPKRARFPTEIAGRVVPLDVRYYERLLDCANGNPGYFVPLRAEGKSTEEHKTFRCPTSHDRNNSGNRAKSRGQT